MQPKNTIAWHHKTGETINIDTLALLIISSDGTPSVVTEELTEEFKELPQLYERVTTVENIKYVYKLYAIVDSSNTHVVINETGMLYYDIATQEFFKYVYRRPKPGAALGWVRTKVEDVNLDAVFCVQGENL